MKHLLIVAVLALLATPAFAQQTAPELPFESVANPLKYGADMNLGEVLGVAVNSKGHIIVLNHPGTSTAGPIYGNATTQLFEFDADGKFVREVGHGVYGLAYAHSVRFDKYDNLWVVDKASMSVMKFNPAGYVTMNLGRRPEGPDQHEYHKRGDPPPVPVDGFFDGTTDVAWDADDNIYVSDGYFNSEIAKFDKHGNWIKRWGSAGKGGEHANENPGQFSNPHNIRIDRQGNVYAADRGNRRIQVFDTDGNFKKFIFLNVPYDKMRHPVLGNLTPNRPDETAPWAICITNGPTQYLYATDAEPGRLYKLSLPDGKILGTYGESGHEMGQFNWAHGLACPTEDTVYVADMNNWRVQKLVLKSRK
jgi:hypothetical protein